MLRPEEKIDKARMRLLDIQERKDDLSNLKKALKQYLSDAWNPKENHLVFHSSGYDSRILSGILMELREERGDDFIGNIRFRCHQPEGEMFNRIMELEGWDKSQYSNYNGPELDHYDIGRVENTMNGFQPHFQSYNFWRDIVPKEKDWVLVSGMYGNHIYPQRGHLDNLNFCDNFVLNRWLNYIRDRGTFYCYYHERFKKIMLPYCSYNYLEALTRVKERYFARQPGFMSDVIHYTLSRSFKVNIFGVPYVDHDYNWKYSAEREAHILLSWKNSKLLRDFGHIESVRKVNPLLLDRFNASMYGFMTFYEVIKRD